MLGDCHVHMALDGRLSFREAISRHENGAEEAAVRNYLQQYKKAGMTFLRDGGDKYGASLLAKKLAPEYGITYLTPAFPIYEKGRYGGILGHGFETLTEYRALLDRVRAQGGDFVKLMLSGLVDFEHYGEMSCEPMSDKLIAETIHIAHEEGFPVMVHCSGDAPALAAIEADVDSLEHGYYIGNETMHALAESDTVWVPTAVTVGNLVQDSRYPQEVTKRLKEEHLWHISTVAGWGGNIALGSDAGAYQVPHVQGALDEYDFLKEELDDSLDLVLETGETMLRWKFGGSGIL